MHGCRFLKEVDNAGEDLFYSVIGVCSAGGGGGGGGIDPTAPAAAATSLRVTLLQCAEMACSRLCPTASRSEEETLCQRIAAARPMSNPCFLAAKAKEHYISGVADNIVRVTQQGVVEVESKYDVDPDSPAFDRVVAQRYGGMDKSEYDEPFVQSMEDQVAGKWETKRPQFLIDYISTRPLEGGGDATDALPEEIKERYPARAARHEQANGGARELPRGNMMQIPT